MFTSGVLEHEQPGDQRAGGRRVGGLGVNRGIPWLRRPTAAVWPGAQGVGAGLLVLGTAGGGWDLLFRSSRGLSGLRGTRSTL